MELATEASTPGSGELDRLLTDIRQTPMELHELRQHAVLAFGRRASAQPPLAVLMQDAVALVGEVLHAQFCGAGELQGDILVLSVHAQGSAKPAAPREHRCAVSDTASMAAFAVRSGSAALSADLGSETRFRDMFLRGLHIVGALTVPLHVNGKPFGVLAVYTTSRHEFSAEDVTFAETVSHLLSTTVARIKVEEKLQETSEIQSSLLGMVDSMVLTLDIDGRIIDINRACEELTKFRLDDVRNRPFWQAMVAPDDSDLVKLIFQSSRGSHIPSEFEGELLTRDGKMRRVSWSLKVLSTGQVQSILVTGRDHTEQDEIKAELDRVKSLTQETTATLSQLTERLDIKRPGDPTPAPINGAAEEPTDEPVDGSLVGKVPLPPVDVPEIAIAATGADQRRSPRRAYRYRQRIAPLTEERFPAPGGFFEVEFWDISACGFSFFMEQLPKFEMLIAALGCPPAVTHFTARVMRVSRMTQGDTTRYLVGCDFLDRVNLPKTRIQ
jgi:PAS domain S-box-containing protein